MTICYNTLPGDIFQIFFTWRDSYICHAYHQERMEVIGDNLAEICRGKETKLGYKSKTIY